MAPAESAPGASTRKPIIAGNWKMNLNHFEANLLVQKLAAGLAPETLAGVEVVVLPPFTALRTVQTAVDGDKVQIAYGAQDLSPHAGGAYTGDIAGSMLSKLGCTYVLAGHSERREYHNEDDVLVNATGAVLAALASRRWWRTTEEAPSDQPRPAPAPAP